MPIKQKNYWLKIRQTKPLDTRKHDVSDPAHANQLKKLLYTDKSPQIWKRLCEVTSIDKKILESKKNCILLSTAKLPKIN